MDPEHTQHFEAMKQEITGTTGMRYCDPTKPLVLQTDTTLKQFIAVFLLYGHPIYFVNKSLQLYWHIS